MAAPDPESFDLLSKVVGAAVAIGVPIWGGKAWLDKQLSAKQDKAHAAQETANCLRHIEKLYENAEEDRKQTRDLHDKAMEAISRNQSEIIGRLK